jgi:outer membrane protein assembly factor BamB
MTVTPGTDMRVRDGASDTAQLFPDGSPVTTSSPTVIAPAQSFTANYPAAVAPAGTELTGSILLNAATSTVFAGGSDGKIYALNSDGTPKWTFDAQSPVLQSYESTQLEFEATPYIYTVTKSGKVYKLQDNNTSAGQPWGGYRDLGSAPSTLLLDSGDSLCVGTADGSIFRIGKDGGLTKWTPGISKAVTGLVIADSPLAGTNAIWAVSDNGTIYRCSNDDGGITESVAVASSIHTDPFLIDGFYDASRNSHDIYFGGDDGYFRCRNSTTLSDKPTGWTDISVSTPIRGSPYHDSATDNIYFGADNGTLYCVNPLTGAVNWTFQARGPIRTTPIPNNAGTKLFFGSDDGCIYGILIADQSLLPGFPVVTGGEVRGSPVCDDANKIIYFGSNDGKVYSIKTGD